MRLLTLNIRFGAGDEALGKPGYDVPVTAQKLAAIAAAVQSVRPDVVALQEVRNAKQAERIARLLKMGCVYVPHRSSYALDFFEWGLAFIYRFKSTDVFNQSIFFDETVRSGRQGLGLTLAVRNRAVTFVNVHLDPRRPDLQIANALAMAARVETPLVLMGDFNCGPNDDMLAPLQQKMIDTCWAVGNEGPREAETVGTLVDRASRIDYIFVEPQSFVVGDAGLLPRDYRRVSDHIGYFAEVHLKPTFSLG